MATVRGVQARDLATVWHRVEPILSRALEQHTDERPNDVMLDIMSERVQLWQINDFQAVCLTQIQVRPTIKVLWIYYVAGEGMGEWIGDLIAVLKAFAAAKGCGRLEFSGRKGWIKALQPHGFAGVSVTMRLELNGQENRSAG